MVDQSIFIIVNERDLQWVICQIGRFTTFVQLPEIIQGGFNSDLWLNYGDEKFYFSLYAKEVNKDKVLLDFDCLDRRFVDVLIENPKTVLQFFLNSIVKSSSAYWVVSPPDLDLVQIYNRLVRESSSIEIAFCKERN